MNSILEEPIIKKPPRSKSLGTLLIEMDKNKKILGQHDLNYIIYHLKDYYNSLLIIRSENKESIDSLKFQEKKFDYLIKENSNKAYEEYSENVSLAAKNAFEIAKNNKESLVNQKLELSQMLDKELEYNQILKNQLKSEIENINYHYNQEIQLKEKLRKVGDSISILELNHSEREKKSRNIAKINEEITLKIKNMNTLIYLQNSKGEDILGNLKSQKSQLLKDKEAYKIRYNSLEKDNNNKKNEYKELFRSVEKIKNNDLERENKIIKTILGLDLIKRYNIY